MAVNWFERWLNKQINSLEKQYEKYYYMENGESIKIKLELIKEIKQVYLWGDEDESGEDDG